MLISRSARESHLYMDLHPCECGQVEFPRDHHLLDRDGVMVSVHEGFCLGCDRLRSFEFGLTGELEPAPPAFGAAEPSRIIDPGEFQWIADRIGADAGLRLLSSPPQEHGEQKARYEYAIAALQEIVKFIPLGADEVPAECFTSERGQELYRRDPSRFRRDELIDNLTLKRRIVNGIGKLTEPIDPGGSIPTAWTTAPHPTNK